MRRLLRWLVNGLCLLSLLACVGAAWMWWRSHRVWDEVGAYGANRMAALMTHRSGFSFTYYAHSDAARNITGHFTHETDVAGPPFDIQRMPVTYFLEWAAPATPRAGVRLTRAEGGGFLLLHVRADVGRIVILRAPAPAIVAALAAAPAGWAAATAARRRQRWALRAGLCPSCGYDLRATPEAGGTLLPRCPECGAASRPGVGGGTSEN